MVRLLDCSGNDMKNKATISWFLLAGMTALGYAAVAYVMILPYAKPNDRGGVSVALTGNPAAIVGMIVLPVSGLLLIISLIMGIRAIRVPGKGPSRHVLLAVLLFYLVLSVSATALFTRCDSCEKSCLRHRSLLMPEGWTAHLKGTCVAYDGPAQARICPWCRGFLNEALPFRLEELARELEKEAQPPTQH